MTNQNVNVSDDIFLNQNISFLQCRARYKGVQQH